MLGFCPHLRVRVPSQGKVIVLPLSVVDVLHRHWPAHILGQLCLDVGLDLIIGPSGQFLGPSASHEEDHHILISRNHPGLRVLAVLVLAHKSQVAFAWGPERSLESHEKLLKNSKTDAVDGGGFLSRERRDELDCSFLEYSQRHSYHQFVCGVRVRVSCYHDVRATVVYLSDHFRQMQHWIAFPREDGLEKLCPATLRSVVPIVPAVMGSVPLPRGHCGEICPIVDGFFQHLVIGPVFDEPCHVRVFFPKTVQEGGDGLVVVHDIIDLVVDVFHQRTINSLCRLKILVRAQTPIA